MSNGKFASTGVVVGQTPTTQWEQKLQHLKGTKVTMGFNFPHQREGNIGDITVREVPTIGLIAYIKTKSGWIDINSMASANAIQWRDMVLVNSWAIDTTFGTPQYSRDANGFVHLRGGCDSGSAFDATIATLPSKFWPRKTVDKLQTRTGSIDELQMIRITSAGVISVIAQRSLSLTSTVSIVWNSTAAESEVSSVTTVGANLDGVSFFAGQRIIGSGGGTIT